MPAAGEDGPDHAAGTAESRAALIAVLLLATLAVGLAAARRTRTTDDFFVAGRRLGTFRAGLAVAASAFSGFVFLGGAGLTGQIGFGSLFIVAPAGFTAALLCRTAGRRLVLIAGLGGARTLPEALRFRFGTRGPATLATAAILAGSVIYLGVQLAALARAARFALPALDIGWGLGIAFAVLLAYSLAGGMVASVNTDVLQGLVMIAAAAAAFWWAMELVGGPAGLAGALANGGPDSAALLRPAGVLGAANGLGLLLLFSVGTLGQPHMLHKFLMLESPAALRFLPAVIGGAQSLSLLVWIGLGSAALALAAGGRLGALAHPDDAALAVFREGGAPEALAGLVAAAVVAAIMSTGDAFLNLGAAALTRDLPRALGRKPFSGLAAARLASVLTGLAAAVVAAWHLAAGGLIAWLGTLGFAAFAVSLAPTMTLGLGWERATGPAAGASILTGLLVLFGLETLAPGFPAGAAVPALGAGFLVLVTVSLLSPGRPLPEPVRLAARL